VDIAPHLDANDTHICLRLRFDSTYWEDYSAGAIPGIGFHIHELSISNITYDMITGEIGDFVDDFENGILAQPTTPGFEWCIGCVTFGEHWVQTGDFGFCTMYDFDGDNVLDLGYPAEPIDEALIWSTEIETAYAAWLQGYWEYSIGANTELTFEISADGGSNWYIISKVTGAASSGRQNIPCADPFDISHFAGKSLLVRVRIVSEGTASGYVCVDSLQIYGKRDTTPPTATIALSGNLIGPNTYAGAVTVTITATDDVGMGQIHYILDGGSTTEVNGNKATFKVDKSGTHTVEYWAVDAAGNIGSRGSASFFVDATPPTVAITAPEAGLYLFGNKILSMSKPIIIGAFTIQATASDDQGIAYVEFFLNDESLGADPTAPYSMYCANKNMGAATIKVVAEDGVGNTAQDTLDVTYYKFL
jgi:hypothetical protein